MSQPQGIESVGASPCGNAGLYAHRTNLSALGRDTQTLINDALAKHVGNTEQPVTAAQVRKIVREELAQVR